MKSSYRNHIATRGLTTAILLTLAAVFLSFLLPYAAHALCVGFEETEKYYSDSTLSHQVGQCIFRECPNGSSVTCWGQETEFFTTTIRTILCSTKPTCSG